MKIIQSEGGPLIGLERDLMEHWSGIAADKFVGNASPFTTDYEALCHFLDRSKPCNIAKFHGSLTNGILITMPLQTALIKSDGLSAYIAQVHYADSDWSLGQIEKRDFEKAEFKERVCFSARGNRLVFFDASYSAEQVGDDCISFELIQGLYVLSAALYYPDPRTHCILYTIERSK